MVPTLFFGLFCFVPLSVMGHNPNWVPDTIPWPAQQCVNKNLGYVGVCTRGPKSMNTNLCSSLNCALPRKDGHHSLIACGKPADGTLCGILKACRGGSCVDIDPDKIPIQTGIQIGYDCTPTRNWRGWEHKK